ncbi:MAG: 3-methylmercaptopropionyl-CoA ligase [Pseudomonadales bacterium]|nr:3-methylmercaptopropionyl-CoA ligase [Pseudomonadales bacterium]
MLGLMQDRQLTLTSIMQHAQRLHGEREIVSVTADQPLHRYRYRDAFARAARLAGALARLGAVAGDRIGTLAWNDYRHLEVYFATSCAGLVCHTINPRLFPGQIEFIIRDAADRWLFVDPVFVPLLAGMQDRLGSVAGFVILGPAGHAERSGLRNALDYETLLADAPPAFDWPELDERSACALCYTSGTTDNPKGVLYSHRALVLHTYGCLMADGMGIGARDVVLPVVPMFHVNAWSIPYGAAVVGAKLVMPGPRMGDGAALARLIAAEEVSVAAGVPTVWLGLLAHLRASGERLPSLRRVMIGGSACPRAIMEEFETAHGVHVHHAWGMTEMSPVGTFNSPSADFASLPEDERWRQRLSVGRPVWGVELRIVDAEGRELPWDGESFGSLMVRGPWVCAEYFRVGRGPTHTADGWFDTGDVATIDPHGYVSITDRAKDVIKSGGEWISSITLENTAVAHPAVAEAAVIGAQHPHWDERPLLCVVLRPGASATREELLAWFDGKVAKWWVPDDVLFLDELPHTATGKLSKKELRERLRHYRFPGAKCDTDRLESEGRK